MASYLDTPRIHFAGHYRADAETTNNMPCNFDVDLLYDPNVNKDWNGMGTNEFAFQNVEVYSAVSSKGEAVNDSVLGAEILDNGRAPFGKIVIQDVDTENTTAIYGLRFGIGWKQIEEGKQNYAFFGNWTPNIISQMLWHKVKCYDDSLQQDTYPRGALATTTLTNVTWKEGNLNSEVLEELRSKSQENGNTLQVSLLLYFYTRNHKEYVDRNFTLGYVVGTVGVYEPGEPLNYGGNRLLSPFKDGNAPKGLKFEDENDSCYGKNLSLFNPWMYKSPFIVNNRTSSLTIDLSNSLPISTYAEPRNIGTVFIGLIHNSCVELLDEVPYLQDNWLWETGGIVDFKLNMQQMAYVRDNAVVAALIENSDGDLVECGQKLLQGADTSHRYIIMLLEDEFYVRPQGFYNARLEKNDTFDLNLYVTSLGRPVEGVKTVVSEYRQTELIPQYGVVVKGDADSSESIVHAVSVTGTNGLARFTFSVDKEMNSVRQYHESPCPDINDSVRSLPIDGQSYQFKYAICMNDCDFDTSDEDITPISIRAFSSNTAVKPYNWTTDIFPIFQQYYHLYPVMSTIVNLTNFSSVTYYPHLQLILHSMTVDFNDPNYMPATRDLSPSKQQMIVDWLEQVLEFYFQIRTFVFPTGDNPFNHSPELVQIPDCLLINYTTAVSLFEQHTSASVCQHRDIPFNTDKLCNFTDLYYIHDILLTKDNQQCTRPLYGYSKDSKDPNIQKLCTKKNLQEQLQLAIQVEFATLPVYLTTLYSIEKACNEEIYNIIRDVAMQEMLHFIQAANILIATGAYPSIDNEGFVPNFPRRGLPGCVHPNLKVYLDRFRIETIHDLFVAIEQPELTCIARNFPAYSNNTIGQLYGELKGCIQTLGDEVFLKDSEQVSWPWPILHGSPLGIVHNVTDADSACLGIEEIVDQGEGASPIDPLDHEPGKQLAHYYRFQEIVCKKHLIKSPDGKNYSYSGSKIHFDPRGVYHMRSNPKSKTVIPNTNCYTEAKAFHSIFRSLLRELQVTFNGKPDNIIKTVELMESLQVHLKRVMRVIYDPTDHVDELTCGPVWDYLWEDAECYN